MSNAIPNVVREMAGQQIPFNPHASSGDYQVAEYTSTGARITKPKVVGGINQLQKIASLVDQSATAKGGRRVVLQKIRGGQQAPPPTPAPKPAKQKPGKKNKKALPTLKEVDLEEEASVEDLEDLITTPPVVAPPAVVVRPKGKKVVFHTNYGMIKATVMDCLSDPQQWGICLVFEDEDAISFIPRPGQDLKVTLPDKTTVKVAFTGIVMTWSDGVSKLMFFLINTDNKADNDHDNNED